MKEKEKEKKMTNGKSKSSSKEEYKDIFDASSSDSQSDDDSSCDKGPASRCADCHGGLHPDKSSWVRCKQCSKTFHCGCVSLKKRPNLEWTCRKCPTQDSADDSSAEDVGQVKTSKKRKSTYEESYVMKALNGDLKRKRLSNGTDLKQKIDYDFVTDEHTKALMLGLRGDKAARQREFQLCEQLIEEAIRHSDSWPFDKPVSKTEVPDYYKVITEPMDLRTMMNKLKRHDYATIQDVIHDYKTIFKNCRKYNQPNSEVYQCGEILEKYMDRQLVKLGLDVNLVQSNPVTNRRKTR